MPNNARHKKSLAMVGSVAIGKCYVFKVTQIKTKSAFNYIAIYTVAEHAKPD